MRDLVTDLTAQHATLARWAPPHATLAWWALAGLDSFVEDAPRHWLRPAPAEPAEPAPAPAPAPRTEPAPALPASIDSLAALLAAMRAAHPGAVLPEGALDAGLLAVAGAPMAEELAAGRAFAGAPGRLLWAMLAAIGHGPASAGIGHLLAWGDAEAAGAALGRAAFERLVALARPRVLLALGAEATSALLGAQPPFARRRGQPVETQIAGHRLLVLPTFHPAHLLRRPEHKALAWADLLALPPRIAA